MIISAQRLPQVYQALKTDLFQSEDKGVIVFVANFDIDALCSCEELKELFKKETITYQIIPVDSYEDLVEHCKTELDDVQDFRTVVFINCGATDDVRHRCQLNENVRIVVIDSHRPIWHGYTTTDSNDIILLDEDDPVPVAEIPSFEADDGELRDGNDEYESEDELEDDMDDEEEEQDQDMGGAGERQRPQQRERPAKRSRQELAEERARRKELLMDYYSGKCGYGKPSSLLMFNLAHALQQESRLHLWMAVLGLTEQLLFQRMDKASYEQWALLLESHLDALHTDLDLIKQRDQEARDGLINRQGRDTMTIMRIDDLRLSLLRHWTLYDTLLFTSYSASRIQTWRERGKEMVQLLLAKMGVPLHQAQAKWMTMKPSAREAIPGKLREHGHNFNLNAEHLMLKSFELQYKNDIRVTACDMVLGLTSLLSRARDVGETTGSNFCDAQDALYVYYHMDLLQRGIDEAKHVSKAIVKECGTIMVRGQVNGNTLRSGCWFLTLADKNIPNQALFQQPGTILRMALHLRDCMAIRNGNNSKPTVVVGAPNAQDCCYVVAVRRRHQATGFQSNPMALPFEEALASADVELKCKSFDNTLFYMHKDHVASFMDKLESICRTDANKGMRL